MRSKYEIKAGEELKEEGYQVDWKIRPVRMMRKGTYSPDYFGLFDLLAYKENKPLRWISIKGKAGIPDEHRKEVENFKMLKGNIKEIWARSQSKKRKKYWYKVIVK